MPHPGWSHPSTQPTGSRAECARRRICGDRLERAFHEFLAPNPCAAGPERRWHAFAQRARRLLLLTCLLLLAGVPSHAQGVVLNEIMSSNKATLADENGDSSDWFELFNPGPEKANLDGWGLSDDAKRPLKWVLQGATLDPGGFMVIYASGKDRQPAASTPLAPDTLSGLRLWLRADAVSTNDATQVRRSGTQVFVRRWNDQSGRGNPAVQEATASQPLWLPGAAAGHAVLRFDGLNDQLLLPRPIATNSFCLFAVFRTSRAHEIDPESGVGVGGVSGQRYLFGAQHGGDANGGAGLSAGTNGISAYEHGSGYMPALAVHAGQVGQGMVVVALNYDAKLPSLDVQGLPARTGVLSPRSQVTAPVEIGAGAYGAFGGDLAEVLLFDRPLTERERLGVEAYLGAKYAVRFPMPRHTSFQLSAAGETLSLARPDGQIVDQVQFGVLPRDVSYGRQADAGARWLFFNQPTPGASNSTPGSLEFLSAPLFSHPGGFYTSAVDLTLSVTNSDADLHYTLDGSEPTQASPIYRAALRLGSRAGTANDISKVPTVPGGQPPLGEVFKGWVVRARAFKSGALPGAVTTRSYWIDARGRSRYTLPVVSLSTDRVNFFDPDIGIYVPGNAPGGNYSQRGTGWERPVHVELYETNNLAAFAQNADIKIHGNTSQNFPIKGLDLDATGGQGRQPFRYPIFPGRIRTEFQHVLLRPSGHDHYMAFMRDELMQELGAETGAENQAARACIVFLNGEYWGLHYLKEKEDDEFVGFYADLPVDAIDYLEGYAAAKAGDTAHYDAMIDLLAENDPALTENYEQIQTLMEVPNYIDYKICEIFNYRWDIGNHRLWRPRTPEGRWRWLQFDNDVGWGGFAAEQPGWAYNMLAADLSTDGRLNGHNNETTTFVLRRLIGNETFRRDFLNRFADLLNTTLSASHTMAHIDRLAAALSPEMAEHTNRWRAPASATDWKARVQYLRDYARNRPAYCRRQLQDYFKIPGTSLLTLAVEPPNAGTIGLNTLDLAIPAGEPWSGAYFRGNPIHLVAHPATGYRFAGWTGLLGVPTNAVSLLLQGDWSITARFAPDAAPSLRADWVVPGSLRLRLTATPFTTWTLETSTNLKQWTARQPLTADADSTAEVIEVPARPKAAAFYRLRAP
jgi:hypothetical protein